MVQAGGLEGAQRAEGGGRKSKETNNPGPLTIEFSLELALEHILDIVQ